MDLIPRVAVFKGIEQEFSSLVSLFRQKDISVRYVASAEEIKLLSAEEDALFDVAVIPMQSESGQSGVRSCIELKSDEATAAISILGLSVTKDSPSLKTFYGAGADMVLVAPIDPDFLFLQITALTKQRRIFDELLKVKYDHARTRYKEDTRKLLQQATRASSLALSASAASLCSKLGTNSDSITLDHILKPQNSLKHCKLDSITTAILEVIDTIANPDVNVKVSFVNNITVNMSPLHLFQFLGHIILSGIDLAGERGDVNVITTADQDFLTAQIEIKSYTSDDPTPLEEFTRSQTEKSAPNKTTEQRWGYGLEMAKLIAANYPSNVRLGVKIEDNGSFLLKATLPVADN